jgi:hypothetical protein
MRYAIDVDVRPGLPLFRGAFGHWALGMADCENAILLISSATTDAKYERLIAS